MGGIIPAAIALLALGINDTDADMVGFGAVLGLVELVRGLQDLNLGNEEEIAQLVHMEAAGSDRIGGVHGVQRKGGVGERFALGDAGRAGGEIDHVRAQALGRDFKARQGSRGVLEEQIDHGQPVERSFMAGLFARGVEMLARPFEDHGHVQRIERPHAQKALMGKVVGEPGAAHVTSHVSDAGRGIGARSRSGKLEEKRERRGEGGKPRR